MSSQYIRWFSELGAADVALVGGKNASLGEMYSRLGAAGVRVPNGFAITADAYSYVLDSAKIWPKLHQVLDGVNPNDVADTSARARAAQDLVYEAPIPADLECEILEAYSVLKRQYGSDLTVAVRSSATAEDLPSASFAGQHETFLNVAGRGRLLDAVRHCFASLFKERAIYYRIENGFDHFRVLLSAGVMKMVRSDLQSSGVIFTLDTETGFRDVILISGAYGLGETVVQGTVDPDEFYVFKPTFAAGFRRVLRRTLGSKELRMVYAHSSGRERTRQVPTPPEDQRRFCISDGEVLQLADAALKIEAHYSKAAGYPMPMDIEWAKDGIDGQMYIVQARPETVASRKSAAMLETFSLERTGDEQARGRAVGAKIATGRARIVTDVQHLSSFQPGEVLVADTTAPDWGTVMKTAAAIVTNRGGRTCHAAIVARELGIPAVVGCENATQKIHTGDEVTVCCAEGEIGKVYAGILPFSAEQFDLSSLPRPKTALMLNLGNPDMALKTSFLPNDGVGLARLEFIVAEYIKIHPMALVHLGRVESPDVRNRIAELTYGYPSMTEYFVSRLSEGVGMIAAAFYPKPVTVRMSDFKTNEYAGLLGGRWFEPAEANPMIGFRGASRYAHPAYADGFALECMAMKRVRDEMGFKNVKLMIPFCRRVQEGERVLKMMAEHGLKRGQNGLEIFVMCEIPNNVVQIDEFSRIFDGFSIGSNDLTQLLLGVDRDSEIVSFDFDERDPGVLAMIRQAIEGARRNRRHCGICGQAPSDYPEVAEFLVTLGIDSISLNPDTLIATTQRVLEVERNIGRATH